MGLIIIPQIIIKKIIKIKEILQHSKRDGQMVKNLAASLVSQKEEERHQRNLNENEQLKKQIAEGTCSRPCLVSHLHRLRLHATHLRLEKSGMKLEGSGKINDAIYCVRNSIQLLGICAMLLSQLKETTSHGLKWNNSPMEDQVKESNYMLKEKSENVHT
ncbi:hypothetical protein RRG08_060631, partial [Elysia crispata]